MLRVVAQTRTVSFHFCGGLLIGLAIAYGLAASLTTPVVRLTQSAEKVSAGILPN